MSDRHEDFGDGTAVLMGFEGRTTTTLADAVVQFSNRTIENGYELARGLGFNVRCPVRAC
jgi:hypothetical protein